MLHACESRSLLEKVFVDMNASLTAPCDPNHGFLPTALKLFGPLIVAEGKEDTSVPAMANFVEVEAAMRHSSTDYCAVMKSQDPSKLTVSTWLAKEFAVFDRWFCSVAGPTWPVWTLSSLFFLSILCCVLMLCAHLYTESLILAERAVRWRY